MKTCYKIEPLNLKSIKMEDLKVPLNNKYNEIIFNDIIKANFQLLKYNDKSLISIFKRFSEGFPINVHISPYQDKKNINNTSDENNNDSLFSYVLSKLVLEEKTQHILLPIINIDVEFSQIENILKSYPIYNEYKELIDQDKISNVFSIRTKAQWEDSEILTDYLNSNKDKVDYKVILFQLIHTLAVIQLEYSDFVHGNLKLSNILVEKQKNSKNIKYVFNDNIYEIGSDIILQPGPASLTEGVNIIFNIIKEWINVTNKN